jgi:hypothetical protein
VLKNDGSQSIVPHVAVALGNDHALERLKSVVRFHFRIEQLPHRTLTLFPAELLGFQHNLAWKEPLGKPRFDPCLRSGRKESDTTSDYPDRQGGRYEM